MAARRLGVVTLNRAGPSTEAGFCLPAELSKS